MDKAVGKVKGKDEMGLMCVGSNLKGSRNLFSISIFDLKMALHVVYFETEGKNAFRMGWRIYLKSKGNYLLKAFYL